MPPLQYALVAYLNNSLGEFVEKLRRELHPTQGHVPAHITVLPPRPLVGTEQEALQIVEAACHAVERFDVGFGDVETFIPTTPTVFIRVAHRAYKMRELHDLINRGPLQFDEPLPYMPHLTIAKLDTIDEARELSRISTERWDTYSGPRYVTIDRLTFVRGSGHDWSDVAPFWLAESVAAKP